MFADDALSQDGFLGGRLQILQPRSGYRAATDPVRIDIRDRNPDCISIASDVATAGRVVAGNSWPR